MAHKTLIGGTSYKISGGKTRANSINYKISIGKTRIGGTNYNISFEPNFDNPTFTTLSGIYLNQTPVYANGYYYAAKWGYTYDTTSGYYSGTSPINLASRTGITGGKNCFNVVNSKLLSAKSLYGESSPFGQDLYIATPGAAAPTFTVVEGAQERTGGARGFADSIVYRNGQYNGIINSNYYNNYFPFSYDGTTLTIGKRIGGTNGSPSCASLALGSNIYVATIAGGAGTTQIYTCPTSSTFSTETNWTQQKSISGVGARVMYYNSKFYVVLMDSSKVYLYTSTNGTTWDSGTQIATGYATSRQVGGSGIIDGRFFYAGTSSATSDGKLYITYSKDLVNFTTYTYDFSQSGSMTCGNIYKTPTGNYYFAIYWDGSASNINSTIVQL